MKTDDTLPATPTAKKPSKVERLRAQLEKARAELEAKRPALEAEIQKYEREKARLGDLYRAADKHSQRAYSDTCSARLSARNRAESHFGGLKLLTEQLRAWVDSRGLSKADVSKLANQIINRRAAQDETLVAAEERWQEANKMCTKAQRAYWGFQEPSAIYQLRHLQEVVEDLEHELEKVPQRNATARERRAEALAARQEEHDTEKALEALGEFVFEAEVKS